jgi:glutamine synthetase type III
MLLMKLQGLQGNTSQAWYFLMIPFACTFSLITVFAYEDIKKIGIFIYLGILDAFGVFIEWSGIEQENIFRILAASYFTIYTFSVVILPAIILKYKKSEQTPNEIEQTKTKLEKLSTVDLINKITEIQDKLKRTTKGLNASSKPETILKKRTKLNEYNTQIDTINKIIKQRKNETTNN